jgi:isoleucyl-tRNA synthetase
VIRLWVASLDYTNDDPLSKEILQRTSEAYRKIRNTGKFLLGNLSDFDPETHSVPAHRLEALECWVLDQAARMAATCREAYGSYAFHSAVRALLEFVTSDLSAFWCDVRKDALYILAADDPVRRSAQTAAFKLVEAIAVALSPVCPFTAEEIFESLPGNAKDPSALFLKSWEDLKIPEISPNERAAWGTLLALRASFLAQLEPLRREGRVGNAAQAVAVVGRGEDVDRAISLLHLSEENLPDVFGTSSVVRDSDAVGVLARPAEGAKCPRCWQVRKDVEPGEDGICGRCRAVVGG